MIFSQIIIYDLHMCEKSSNFASSNKKNTNNKTIKIMKTFILTLTNQIEVGEITDLALNLTKKDTNKVIERVRELKTNEAVCIYKIDRKLTFGTWEEYLETKAKARVEIKNYNNTYFVSIVK